MLSLLRCRFWKSPSRRCELICGTLLDGDSMWIARAPQSASWRTAVGPRTPGREIEHRVRATAAAKTSTPFYSPCRGRARPERPSEREVMSGTAIYTVAEAAVDHRPAREAPREHPGAGARVPAVRGRRSTVRCSIAWRAMSNSTARSGGCSNRSPTRLSAPFARCASSGPCTSWCCRVRRPRWRRTFRRWAATVMQPRRGRSSCRPSASTRRSSPRRSIVRCRPTK